MQLTHYEMIVRIALALEVSADELLGMKKTASTEPAPDMKLVRRLKKIESLPVAQRKAILKTIDTFLKGPTSEAYWVFLDEALP